MDGAGFTGSHPRHFDPRLSRLRPHVSRPPIRNRHLRAFRQRRSALQHHDAILHTTRDFHASIFPGLGARSKPSQEETQAGQPLSPLALWWRYGPLARRPRAARRQHRLQWGRDSSVAESSYPSAANARQLSLQWKESLVNPGGCCRAKRRSSRSQKPSIEPARLSPRASAHQTTRRTSPPNRSSPPGRNRLEHRSKRWRNRE